MPSVLWRCWLGGRKGTRPVKNWVVGCWRGYLSGAKGRLAYGPADATASVKSRSVLPFWYRLTQVVPKRAIKQACVCVCYVILFITLFLLLTVIRRWSQWCGLSTSLVQLLVTINAEMYWAGFQITEPNIKKHSFSNLFYKITWISQYQKK